MKAIVIAGAGDNFCSGGDVHEIIGPLTKLDKAGLLTFTQLTGDLVKAMRACLQPVIAAIDGVTVQHAARFSAMASDGFVWERRAAKLHSSSPKVGLAGCDMGACAILPRIIGQGRASELLFTGRSMLGDEAERWGFLNRMCTSEELMPEAMSLAAGLASGPTFAHSITKKMLHEEWNMGVDQAIDAEAEATAICMTTNGFSLCGYACVRQQAETGIQGRLRVPSFPHLDWPFFEPRHKTLAIELDRWATSNLAHDHGSNVDDACRGLVRQLGAAGWLNHAIGGTSYGATSEAIDTRAICLIRETLARHSGLADFAFAMQGLGSGAITLFGNAKQKKKYLPRVAKGEAISAFALSELNAGSDVAAMQCEARREGDGYVLNGDKTWISNGGIADFYVVFARTGEAEGSRGVSALKSRRFR